METRKPTIQVEAATEAEAVLLRKIAKLKAIVDATKNYPYLPQGLWEQIKQIENE